METMGYESAGELLERTKDYLFDRSMPGALMTGFENLDLITGGFNKGELICIAGRPAMGKTGFALSMIKNICIEKGKSCLYFSLEHSGLQLLKKLISFCSVEKVEELSSMRDLPHVERAILDIGKAPLYINDMPALSVEEIRELYNRGRSNGTIDLIIIDYFQLISDGNLRGDNSKDIRNKKLSELKRFASEAQCPVIVLSQLSRDVEKRKDHRPLLKDLRVTGNFERFVDKILFIYRDEYYCDDTERKGIADIIVAKNHMGYLGTVSLVHLWGGYFVDMPKR